jgi:hypothetical protein
MFAKLVKFRNKTTLDDIELIDLNLNGVKIQLPVSDVRLIAPVTDRDSDTSRLDWWNSDWAKRLCKMLKKDR